LTIEQIATECGFSSAELLRRAFHRTLGSVPSRIRENSAAPELVALSPPSPLPRNGAK
jgi:transcriptional regulator GlxA family with amidase domain